MRLHIAPLLRICQDFKITRILVYAKASMIQNQLQASQAYPEVIEKGENIIITVPLPKICYHKIPSIQINAKVLRIQMNFQAGQAHHLQMIQMNQ